MAEQIISSKLKNEDRALRRSITPTMARQKRPADNQSATVGPAIQALPLLARKPAPTADASNTKPRASSASPLSTMTLSPTASNAFA